MQSQRMDSVYRGPLGASFINIVTGLVSTRSYERNTFFRMKFVNELERSVNATFTNYLINRYFGIKLNAIILFFTISVATFSIFSKFSANTSTEQLAFNL